MATEPTTDHLGFPQQPGVAEDEQAHNVESLVEPDIELEVDETKKPPSRRKKTTSS